ncbi:Translation initiation factor eIF-2B subunit epsilon [Halotydeus destructor]|nr:Translation initiation factor eIF-2B subunit epsilon [Halotydeus destructor]
MAPIAREKGLQEKQVVQAVVIADSFNHRFQPLTKKVPRVLLPLINRPMLDYSLRFLKLSGIHEVFVFCCTHSGMIRNYIKENWSEEIGFTVNVQSSENYLSVGDILRDVDQKGLIKSDFVLIHGDVVGNIGLLELLEAHKTLRQTDKGSVMTQVYMKSEIKHKTRSQEDDVILVTDGASKILHYEKVSSTSRKLEFPLRIFRENSEVIIQRDVQATHISICSVNVPMLFSENVDYQTTDDFIRGILVDEEILGHSVYIRVVNQGYAARALNPVQYDSISKDLMRRWIYPVIPDKILDFAHRRSNIYLHKNQTTDLLYAMSIEKNVVVGENTVIASQAVIKDSVIGRNCSIGKNVVLDSAYIFDDVTIEEGCELRQCIVADRVKVLKNTKIQPGCILGHDVIVGPELDIARCTLLQSEPNRAGEHIDKQVVGQKGQGYLFHDEEDSSSESDTFAVEIWGQDENEESDHMSSSGDSHGSRGSDDDIEEDDEFKIFYHEILDNFKRGIKEQVKAENLVLEVNSVKHAYNIPINEVNMLVFRAMLDLPNVLEKPLKGSYIEKLRTVLTGFIDVIRNYVKSAESQNDALVAIEQFYHLSQKNPETNLTATVLVNVLSWLYDKDVLDEDVILRWYLKPRSIQGLLHSDAEITLEEQEALRKQSAVKKFIEWLNEDDEESDDE